MKLTYSDKYAKMLPVYHSVVLLFTFALLFGSVLLLQQI